MDLIRKVKGDTLILAPDGLFDEDGAKKLLQSVQSTGEEISKVIFDGTLMTGIEPDGLRTLVMLHEKLSGAGKDLLIRRPGEQLMAALELTELVYLFRIEE